MRAMRKKDRELSKEEGIEILKTAKFGNLALTEMEGYPYCIPISFAYEENKIYIHTAVEGKKLDAIEKNNKICFTAVSDVETQDSKFSTLYKSVILFGTIKEVFEEEKIEVLMKLVGKYSKGFEEGGLKYANAAKMHTRGFIIDVEKMTVKGKLK